MTTTDLETIAINQIGFEYFKSCIANGSTPEQAKSEMLTESAQKEIARRIKEILN